MMIGQRQLTLTSRRRSSTPFMPGISMSTMMQPGESCGRRRENSLTRREGSRLITGLLEPLRNAVPQLLVIIHHINIGWARSY